MQSRDFLEGLYTLPRTSLLQVYAISHLTTRQVRWQILRYGLAATVAKQVASSCELKVASLSRDELILLVLTRLMEHLHIPLGQVGSSHTLLHAANRVAEVAFQRLKETGAGFRGATFRDMIEWQLDRLISNIVARGQGDAELSERLLKAVERFLEDSCPDRRTIVQQQPGTPESTGGAPAYVRSIDALESIASVVVQDASGSSLSMLSMLLARLSDTRVLSLPFGAGRFASCLFAIALGPWAIDSPSLVARWRQITSDFGIQVPAALVSLCMLNRPPGESSDLLAWADHAVATWKRLRDEWAGLCAELDRVREHRKLLEASQANALREALRQATQLEPSLTSIAFGVGDLSPIGRQREGALAEAARLVLTLERESRAVRQQEAALGERLRAWAEPRRSLLGTCRAGAERRDSEIPPE